MRKMTGYAPVKDVYMVAGSILFPGSIVLTMTRVKYATLALMARNGGDYAFKDVGSRRVARMKTLEGWGLVKKVPRLRRWELTANGWRLLNAAEEVYYMRLEEAVACKCAFCGVTIADQGGLCEAVACNDKADFAMDAYYEGA